MDSLGLYNFFDFPLEDIDMNKMTMKDIGGEKATLIINVACYWGLTDKNFIELEYIYNTYKDQGL